ncbi:MAG: ABC transporter ATP-binding protein [Candidatus Omnitrophica bacterium]|nr:ABC transporter ATP-binding protein [Candidatus Omnitrophota bacterium]
MLEARELHKTYRMGANPLHVLRGVSLQVAPGEFLAITGPSGAGKSTLLHLLAGLDIPTQGEVLWEGRSLSRMSDRERSRFRHDAVGFVFQFYHLLPELSALENVMLPGLLYGGARRRDLRERALSYLERVGLKDRFGHRPNQLSGGELQRAAIARALVNHPKVLLCDEPTGNLDSQTGQEVARLLIEQRRHEGISLVLVTHEHALAELADRWLILRDGQFAQEGIVKPAADSSTPSPRG